jgi:hypothetical protein
MTHERSNKMNRECKKDRPRRHSQFAIGRLIDPVLARASGELDFGADRDWFRQHPGSAQRTRAATPIELLAYGLRPGTAATVLLVEEGVQVRVFSEPRS